MKIPSSMTSGDNFFDFYSNQGRDKELTECCTSLLCAEFNMLNRKNILHVLRCCCRRAADVGYVWRLQNVSVKNTPPFTSAGRTVSVIRSREFADIT